MYSWPSSIAVSAISRIGEPPSRPVGMHVAVAAQRLAQLRADLGDHAAAGRLQPTEVDRLLAPQRSR